MKCIVCQSNDTAHWSKSFCSRICETLWLRMDLAFMSCEQLKRIALSQLGNTNG